LSFSQIMNSRNELKKLIDNLPLFIQAQLVNHYLYEEFVEILLDLGRRPEVRFINRSEYLSQKLLSWQDLDYVIKRISNFSTENRAGIDRTLHRISCIRNRQFLINGLTCRVGRAIFGTISIIRDLLESEKSILILGKPGTGKTTIIREIARVLSDEMEKRVIVIDTSNEIGGDSDISHFGIGRARRMQVPATEFQHEIMIEAVENHMPQIIIVDEIGTELEILAAKMIAEKGVQLIGTTHGTCLENLIKNPSLSDLIGGIKYVTLSDEEAKRRGTQKSILERKTYPAFEIVIEINKSKSWVIYENVKIAIDKLLRNSNVFDQVRQFNLKKKMQIRYHSNLVLKSFLPKTAFVYQNLKNWELTRKMSYSYASIFLFPVIIIYPYSISVNLFREVFTKLEIKIILTTELQKAHLIIGLKTQLQQNRKLKKLAKQKNVPIYSFNQLSFYQLVKFIKLISLGS